MVGKKRSQEEEATAEDAERNSGQPRIMDSGVSTCSTVWSQNISSHQQ
jgi:hypothetical protein